MTDLRPLAAVAAEWQRHPRTVRRQLAAAMAADRGLRVTRIGRSVYFTPQRNHTAPSYGSDAPGAVT